MTSDRSTDDSFQTLADNAPDLIFRIDRGLRHVFVNRRVLEVTGLTPDQYLGRTNRDLGMPDELCDLWDRTFRKVFETGKLQELEFTYPGPQGINHFQMRIVPERNREGRVETALGITRDITRQKQDEEKIRRQARDLASARASLEQSQQELASKVAERTSQLEDSCRRLAEEINAHETTSRFLQNSLTLLESIFAGTHFLLAYMDRDFHFLKVNRSYAEAAGRTPAFFEGKNHFDLYPHKDNEAVFRRVVKTGEPHIVQEKPFEYPDRPDLGVTYWDWSLHPVKDDKGEVTGVILGLVDVTERRQAREALDQSREIYRKTLEKSLDGFTRVDMNNRFIEVNPAFEEMVGYSLEELRRMTVQDITPEPFREKEAGMMETLLKTGHTPLYEKEYLRKDGSRVPAELRVYLSSDDEGHPREMWAFVSDITERKQQEAKSIQYLQSLERSNRELEEFAYVASHDLQEPLRKIQMFGDRIWEKYADRLDERGLDYLERMVSASTRMRSLIRALLEYSRVSTHTRPFERVDMNQAFQEALSNLEFRIREAGGTVETGDLPPLAADYSQMVQLMQNLVANALKFHRPDVPPIVKVTAREVQEKRKPVKKKGPRKTRIQICIQDNGIGFDDGHRDKIFLPFQRLHGRVSFEGVGMGLAICRKIVERHGGSIEAESEEGKGSTFIVTLPAQTDPYD
jgi:two-component system sensor kinase FixL